MTALLEKALQKVEELPKSEQDVIASQILESLSDEEAWRERFAATERQLKRLIDEALAEDERGETRPLDQLL